MELIYLVDVWKTRRPSGVDDKSFWKHTILIRLRLEQLFSFLVYVSILKGNDMQHAKAATESKSLFSFKSDRTRNK